MPEEPVNQPNMGISGTSMELKTDSYLYDTNYHRFADYLGIDEQVRKNRQVAEKMSFIYDWAKEQVGRDDRDTIMRALNDYQKGIGEQSVGKTLLDRLYRDIRLGVSGEAKKTEKTNEKSSSVKKEASVNVKDAVTSRLQPVMKRVEKQIKETIKQGIDQSINKVLKDILK